MLAEEANLLKKDTLSRDLNLKMKSIRFRNHRKGN